MTIGALSRAIRVPVGTIRTWERRYGAPRPVRKSSGHRLYPLAEVERMRRIARLLARGHRPAEILGLSLPALDALLELAGPPGGSHQEVGVAGPVDVRVLLADLMDATIGLDRRTLMNALREGWVRAGPLAFLDGVAGAFLVEIGRAWQAGSCQVGHEHFASGCLRDFLRATREPYEGADQGPRAVAATLPGEEHEGGLLIASTLLAVRGYRVVYLGANTPVEQIVSAAGSSGAEVVAASVSAAMSRAVASRALERLRRLLPARVALWVGGAGAPPASRGIERFESAAALDARLAGTAPRPPGAAGRRARSDG